MRFRKKNNFLIFLLTQLISESLWFALSKSAENSEETVLLIEFTRHGAREPVYHLFPSITDDFQEFEQLTALGKHQHYLIGSELRARYITKEKFLSQSYNRSEILAYSTEYTRTIESAQSQLFGLYPPSSIKKEPLAKFPEKDFPSNYRTPSLNISKTAFDPENPFFPFDFQPIPVITFPRNMDKINFPWKFCPIMNQAMENLTKEHLKSELHGYLKKNLYPNIARFLNITEEEVTFHKGRQLGDVIDNYIYHGRDILKNFEQKDKLESEANFALSYYYLYYLAGYENIAKLMHTPIFQEIQKLIRDKINSPLEKKYKFVLFSTHDTTLQIIMNGLNITSPKCLEEKLLMGKTNAKYCFNQPEYASVILFRLLRKGSVKELFIEVSYNDQKLDLCPEQGDYCSVDSFFQKLQYSIDPNFESSCSADSQEPQVRLSSAGNEGSKKEL